MKTSLTLLWLLLPLSLMSGQTEPNLKGKAAFDMNCAACHLLEYSTVGPSLVKIAETYPSEQSSAFIAWAKNPGKKDPKMIQMPSMAHVAEDTLKEIHQYLLQATAGKTEKRGRHQFPPFKEPKRELPYVFRAFLPNASPASIAVVLKENVSIGWDTDSCRFLYAWTGSATKLKSGRGPAELPETFYTENAASLWSFGEGRKPQFIGYQLVDKYPEFHYSIGDVQVREKISNGPNPGSLVRAFSLSGSKGRVSLNLSHMGNVSISSDKGSLDGNTLTLNAKQAQSFSLTITPK